jgi:ABC-type transport system involved in multi-copper enzyme maturation permease subunit
VKPAQLRWKLWHAQTMAVLRLEWKRSFLPRRGLWIYLLAIAPVLIFAAGSAFNASKNLPADAGENARLFAGIFQFFFLRFAVFFGCAGIFMNLFRGEMLDKSLHYYFLAPVRREVLLAAKYLAGLLASSLIFCASVTLQMIVLNARLNAVALQEYFFHGHGLAAFAAYLGVTFMACLGYGGVFLAIGVVFRNGLIPAALVLAWETINSVLPPVLQRVSVIYYLKSLCPLQASTITLQHHSLLTLFSLNVPMASGPVALVALAALTMILLGLAGWRLREMEIDYGVE